MDELVRSGKVRYVGAGNVSGWQMQKIVDTAEKFGCHPWVSLQVRDDLLVYLLLKLFKNIDVNCVQICQKCQICVQWHFEKSAQFKITKSTLHKNL